MPLSLLIVVLHLLGTSELVQIEISPSVAEVIYETGTNLSFDCTVSDYEPEEDISIKWFKNGELLPLEVGLNGDDNLELHLNSIKVSDNGDYTCKVIDQSKTIKLTVYDTPRLEKGLEKQHLRLHREGSIKCLAETNLDVTYRWQFKGARISRDRNYVLKNNELSISNVSKTHEGQYGCIVKLSKVPRTWTFPIGVDVQDPPHMNSWKGLAKAMEGTSASIICGASGAPKPTFKFYKDNSTEPIQSSPLITVNPEEGKLYWQNVSLEDSGTYICEASNSLGKDSRPNRLIVTAAPRISDFDNRTFRDTETLKIKCRAVGSPTPKVEIFKFNSEGNLTLKKSNVNSGEQGTIFEVVVEYIKEERIDVFADAGSYGCSAENNYGEALIVSSVEFLYAPFYNETQREDEYILLNHQNNITCQVFSNPPVIFQWTKNGLPIESRENDDVFQVFNEIRGRTSKSTLQITPTSDESGAYVCKASNKFGDFDTAIVVKEAAVPSKPHTLQVHEKFSTSIILAVKDGWNGGNPISKYNISYNVSDNEDSNEAVIEKVPQQGENFDSLLRIENLSPKTRYEFHVSGVNLVGAGPAAVIGAETEVMSVPQQVVVVKEKLPCYQPSDVVIRWIEPDSSGSPLEKYRVQYREVTDSGPKQWVTKETTFLKYRLEGLHESTKYDLRVAAKNAIGWSQDSEPRQFHVCRDISPVHSSASETPKQGSSEIRSSNTGWLLGIVFAVLVVVCIIVDLACYVANGCGVTKFICTKIHGAENDKTYGDKAENEEREILNMDDKQNKTQPTEV